MVNIRGESRLKKEEKRNSHRGKNEIQEAEVVLPLVLQFSGTPPRSSPHFADTWPCRAWAGKRLVDETMQKKTKKKKLPDEGGFHHQHKQNETYHGRRGNVDARDRAGVKVIGEVAEHNSVHQKRSQVLREDELQSALDALRKI